MFFPRTKPFLYCSVWDLQLHLLADEHYSIVQQKGKVLMKRKSASKKLLPLMLILMLIFGRRPFHGFLPIYNL